MLQHPPREKEWLSWLTVALWALVIFATIPLARALQGFVQSRLGREAFAWMVIACVVLAAAAALRQVGRLGAIAGRGRLWILGVAGVFAGYTYALRGAPEEALHFVEYGVLGVLACRALSHRTRDASLYVSAALIGALVGILDEAIQWATPQRFWGLRDIWLNFFAAALVQVGIAKGLRPGLVAPGVTRAGLRRACRLALLVTVLLGASLLNTPARIAWTAERVPALAFLARNESVMLEYGHLYEDPEIGRFRSRLSPAELAESDATRAPAAAAILDRHRDEAEYRAFLAQYTPVSDPFLHEARVHLFRRDRYLARAAAAAPGSPESRRLATVAQRENRILEKYFPRTLGASGYGLPAAQRARLERDALPDSSYESGVSRELVTSVGEGEVAAGLALTLLALATLHRRLGRQP